MLETTCDNLHMEKIPTYVVPHLIKCVAILDGNNTNTLLLPVINFHLHGVKLDME